MKDNMESFCCAFRITVFNICITLPAELCPKVIVDSQKTFPLDNKCMIYFCQCNI